LRRSIDANRNYSLSHFTLAAALVNVGQMEEARSAVGIGLALDREFTIASFCASAWSDNPVYLAQRAPIIEGMRKAGVPEGQYLDAPIDQGLYKRVGSWQKNKIK
jgi:hypothetical protein